MIQAMAVRTIHAQWTCATVDGWAVRIASAPTIGTPADARVRALTPARYSVARGCSRGRTRKPSNPGTNNSTVTIGPSARGSVGEAMQRTVIKTAIVVAVI